jgi:hypothetical protein
MGPLMNTYSRGLAHGTLIGIAIGLLAAGVFGAMWWGAMT